MAITRVSGQQNSALTASVASGGTASVVLPNNPTAGNLVVVGFNGQTSTITTVSVADSNGNSYTPIFTLSWDGNVSAMTNFYYLANAPANATKTITATVSGQSAAVNVAVWASEYAGVATSSPLETSARQINSGTAGTNVNTPSITTANVDLILALIASGSGSATTVNSPFSRVATDRNLSGACTVEDFVQTSSGAQTPAATLGASVHWNSLIAAFKPAAGGTTLVTSDSGGRVEFTSTLRSDALVLLEYLAGISVDSVVRIENIAAVRLDNAGSPEFVEGLSAGVAGQLEFLGSLRADNLAPPEIVAAFRSDVLVLMETLAGQRSDMIVASEIVAALRADLVAPIENTGTIGVTTDGAVQIENIGSLRSDQTALLETLFSVHTDDVALTSFVSGVASHSGVQLETTGALQSGGVVLLETLGQLQANVVGSSEAVTGVTLQAVAGLENVMGVTTDIPAQAEALSGVIFAAHTTMPLEFAGGALTASEWIIRARRRFRR